MEVSKVRRVFLEPLGSNSRHVGCRIVLRNCPNPSECTMDMNECRLSDRMLKYLSPVRVVSRRIRGPISRQLHTSHTITEAHQIEQSPVDKQGLWINDLVPILVHVHPSDTIGNESRQTRQRVSSHQQSNGSVVGPRKKVKLCSVQSATVHE
ncbi:hypothetical protein AVEN_15433-1 [Araneus ventricosus]|uniref:Uncharacterized protein n=1 Tax=Araneus ventricosus TaxID=182803 RepID=A0A4Y2CRV3_ARAVE|nr:hypothetical protein AVEN_15433-1 [Araneus ventricosus]